MARNPFNRSKRATVAALLFALPLGCKASSDASAVARVNGQVIETDEFRSRLHDDQISQGKTLEPVEESMRLKQRVLNELIEEKVMLAEADRRKLSVSGSELERAWNEIRADYSEAAFNEMLKKKPMSQSRLREQLRKKILLEKVIGQVTQDVPSPSGTQLEKYYREHLDDFSHPEQIHLQQIVVQTADDGDKILQELSQGKSFEQLAQSHSFTPEASQGGDLGFLPVEALPKELAPAVAKLPENRLSPVIQTEYGYHVVRVLGRTPAHRQTLEEAKPTIVKLLTQKDREMKFAQWRTTVLSQAKIERNYGLLAQIQ